MRGDLSRLDLVDFDDKFLPDLFKLRSDPETQELLLSSVVDMEPSETSDWIRRRLDESTTMFRIATSRVDGSFVGFIQFVSIHGIHARCEMGVAMARSWRGKGLANELITLGMDRVSRERGVSKFSVHVKAENERARRLYEKLGFEEVGLFRRHYRIGDRWCDALVMELNL